jgi:ERF superfamily
MQKSNTIGEIAKALSTFHVKVEKIKKDASLSNILDVIDIPLAESGLSFAQFPTDENGLTTIIMHGESGEWMESNYKMRPIKDDPQGIGSCITYQRRYALSAILGLNIDDDDDGNHATHGGSTPEKAADNKPWLNEGTKEFAGAVKKLKEKTTTMQKIKEGMKVSREVEMKLLAAIQINDLK